MRNKMPALVFRMSFPSLRVAEKRTPNFRRGMTVVSSLGDACLAGGGTTLLRCTTGNAIIVNPLGSGRGGIAGGGGGFELQAPAASINASACPYNVSRPLLT